jgi:hypothetical protein
MSLKYGILMAVGFSLVASTVALAQDDTLSTDVSFVKGSDAKVAESADEVVGDEVVGTVVETANPYTRIPKPSGVIVGTVFEPSKDGKSEKSAAPSMLQLLMQGMNANSRK